MSSDSDLTVPDLPAVQHGIQRVYDEASTYYRTLRWEKNRLARFEYQLTQRVLEEELGPQRVERGLELGCGPGTWTGLLAARAAQVRAVDLSSGMLEQARRAVSDSHVEFVQADAARYHDGQRYQRAISVRVLEYIPEWTQVVARLGELVEPGGRLVLVTKTRFSVWRGTGRARWWVAYPKRLAKRLLRGPQRSDFWQRHISVRALTRALTEAGFTEIRVRPVIFGLPIFQRGTQQYPLLPEALEPAALRLTEAAWRWASDRGPLLRRMSLVFSESYAVSARRR